MKKILSILLVICTLLALCGCGKDSEDDTNTGSSATIEGSGFKSPEKAILAYAEALQSGDVREILSTFAVETYVDSLDMEAYLDQSGSYMISQGLVSEDDYSREIRLVKRQYELTQLLSYLYLFHSQTGVSYEPISPRGDPYENASDLIDALTVEDWMEILEDMEIGDVLTAEDIIPDKISDGYTKNLENLCVRYGCDELFPLAVEITLDGEDYYLCVDVACYDGKWYNLSMNGIIGIMLGAGSDTGYLAER